MPVLCEVRCEPDASVSRGKVHVFRGAHGLVLSARSAFFATALDTSFVERGRRQVHLGIVEAR